MKTRKLVIFIIAMALIASMLCVPASATSFTAMIVQGNTKGIADCKVVFEALKNVPNGNSYTISNRGWTYDNGNSFHNYSKWTNGKTNSAYPIAGEQHLIEARSHDVLYWSGHGGNGSDSDSGIGPKLNAHPKDTRIIDYGPGETRQPEIDVASALGVREENWKSTSQWNKNSRLTVAIFAACSVLDNYYGGCKYLARAMKASNVRVIAGYHENSKPNPWDIYIAHDFFYGNEKAVYKNRCVTNGESIRSSWEAVNEVDDAGPNWAVLCYKEGGNQYYRLPGFPGKTYAAPSEDATVYRYRADYKDPTGGEIMPTGQNIISRALPIEVRVSAPDSQSLNSEGKSYFTMYREMNADVTGHLDEEAQGLVASDYIDGKYKNGIELIGTVFCEEVDEDVGCVPGTEVVVGKNFCYNNQYGNVRLLNNFYKVCTDSDGIYMVVDRWRDVTVSSEETTANTAVLTSDSARRVASYADKENITDTELVYVPINENTYRLCYEMTSEYSAPYYLDAVTGNEITVFCD